MAEFITEAEAAELEGIVQISDTQLALVKRRRQLIERRDKINAELDEIRDALAAQMESDSLSALTFNGKAIVQRTSFEQKTINTAGLKAAYPEIATEFTLVKDVVRVTIR